MSMNEWIAKAKAEADPATLFGEMWFEGEMALLLGEIGSGKSVLAMQIAESLARRRPIDPIGMNAASRHVLYVDLEMTAKQYEMRYSADAEALKRVTSRYRFSDDLRRLAIDPERLMAGKSAEETAESLARRIDIAVRRHGSEVVIIDSLSALKRSYYGSAELLPVIRRLRRLMNDLGVSILITADAPRSGRCKSLTLNTLGGLKLAASVVDSIIAIGPGGWAADQRYLKHLRSRSSQIAFDALHLPVFAIQKIGGNFLGFIFVEYTAEACQLQERQGEHEHRLIQWIHRLRAQNVSYREIARRCGRSKSTVHRMAQMFRPEPQAANTVVEATRDAFEPEDYAGDDASEACDAEYDDGTGRYADFLDDDEPMPIDSS